MALILECLVYLSLPREPNMTSKLILNANDNITCPHCEREFPIRDAVAKHLIEQHEADYLKQLNDSKEQMTAELRRELERSVVKDKQREIEELQQQLVDSKEGSEKLLSRLEKEKKKAAAAALEQFREDELELKEKLERQTQQLATFRQQEKQLREEKAQIEESRVNLELELQRKLDNEKEALRAKLEESYKLREAEYQKKLHDAAQANETMKRKLEQGSQQLQGEVLELELENILSADYPLDNIEAVKSGARGADVIQTVRMRSGTECGKIVWETKRTENWSNGWIGKLKTDMQNVNGDIGVIVTAAFPSDIKEPMAIKDGVWLVKPNLVRSLVEALRSSLLEVQRQKAISSGREQHLEAVYDYVCSIQFMQRIKAVVAHQQEMKKELDKERNALTRIWNKREKQIAGITDQMVSMVGELQGLADDGMPLLEQIAELDD